MDEELPLLEQWTIQELMTPQEQGTPFLSCVLGDYLDKGDFVALKHNMIVTPDVTSNLGLIIEFRDPRTMKTTPSQHTARWGNLIGGLLQIIHFIQTHHYHTYIYQPKI